MSHPGDQAGNGAASVITCRVINDVASVAIVEQ